jgi:hypothetical protein
VNTTQKLVRFAQLLFDAGQFPSLEAAIEQVAGDYPKGYPNDKQLDFTLKASDEGMLAVIEWDRKTGNYTVMRYR